MSILGACLFGLKLFCFGLTYIQWAKRVLAYFGSLIILFSKFCLYIFLKVFNLLFIPLTLGS